MKQIVYISGPITGKPAGNRPAFDAAAAALRERGFDVVNPHEVFTEPLPADPAQHRAHWQRAMRADLRALTDCDAIALLPGWQASEGALWEVDTARRLGLGEVFLAAEVA
jgi:nucleoside 2-deoxyribosyltransferase